MPGTAHARSSRFVVSGAFLALCLHGTLNAQLVENLKAFASRHPLGDPEVRSNWERGKEGPKGLASADLDDDGRPDLAASNLDGTVTVYFNDGDGELSEPLHLRTNEYTLRDIVIDDLTGDGLPDIATAAILSGGFGDGAVVIFPNAGGRVFEAPRRVPTWVFGRDLATGDFDGDGRRELVVAGPWLGLMQFELGDDGVLAPVWTLDVVNARGGPKPVYSLLPFRSDGADRDELLVTHENAGSIWRLRADEMGRLQLQSTQAGFGNVIAMRAASIVARASEGRADLVTADRRMGTIDVRRQTGTPGIFEGTVAQRIHVPGGPRALEVVDLDGDGWNDLVVALRCLDRVVTYRNVAGTLELEREMPVGRSPRELAGGDFDGDGQIDHAVINRVSSDMSVLVGFNGQAGFASLDQTYLVDGRVVGLRVLDFNGDGRDDVVQIHNATDDVSVRLAGEDGTLAEPVFYPMGTLPAAQEIVDVNNDGINDIVTADLGETDAVGSVTVRLGNADGTMGEAMTFTLNEGFEGRLFALIAADFDGDGNFDLAAGYFDCRLAFFRGNGDGTFEHTTTHFFVYESRTMAVADFDQDGDIDLAGGGYAGDVVVVENHGDLLTTPVLDRHDFLRSWEGKFGVREIEVFDLNDDGDPDLVAAGTNETMVFTGLPGVDFHREVVPVAGPASGVATGDFDANGRVDLAVSCQLLSCVILLTQDDAGRLVPALSVDVPSAEFIASGDLDGDGKTDLVGTGDVLWTALSSRGPELSEPAVLQGERVSTSKVSINELLAVNNDFAVEPDGGRKSDWVELYNDSGEPVSLGGWRLTLADSEGGAPKEFAFPPTAVMEPSSHLLIVFSNTRRSPLHTGFRLPGSGGELALHDNAGQLADLVRYPEQRDNVSFARYKDGLHAFVFNNFPSPERANVDNGPLAPIMTLDSGVSALRGGGAYACVEPFQPIRFFATGDDDVGIVTASLIYERLDQPGAPAQRVILYDDGMNEDGGMQDGLFSGVIQEGLPPRGELRFWIEVEDFTGATTVIPDAGNASGRLGATGYYSIAVSAANPGLELSEVVAQNESGLRDESGGTPDWVELRNCSESSIRLDGFFLGKSFPANESWFEFPLGSNLAPGEHVVVYCDNATDQGAMHAPFTIDAEGDQVLLIGSGQAGATGIVDGVVFETLAPDVALARTDCAGSWVEAEPTPGSSAVAPLQARRGDVNRDGVINISDPVGILDTLFRAGSVTCLDAADVNGDTRIDVSDAVYLLVYLFGGGDAPSDDSVICR